MLDPDDCHATRVHALDEPDEFLAFMLREAAGDLVEQQQARVSGERAGELQPFAVEEREPTGRRVGVGPQPTFLQDVQRPLLRERELHPGAVGRADHQILEHRQVAERLWHLIGARNADPATLFGRQPRHVAAEIDDRAGVEPQRAGDEAETSSFPRRWARVCRWPRSPPPRDQAQWRCESRETPWRPV